MNASLDRLLADPPAAQAGSLSRHLEVAIQIARSGIWEWRVVSGEVLMSDGYLRLLGVDDPSEIVEPRAFWLARIHPDDFDLVISTALDHAAGRTSSLEIEYRLKHMDGRWVHVLDRGRVIQRDAKGRAAVVVGFVMDITERCETEAALRASEERLRLATDAVNGFIYEVDLATDVAIRYGVEKFTGYSSEEIDRLPGGWLSLVHDGDRERVQAEIARHRVNLSDYQIEYRLIRRDGIAVHVWHRGASLNVESGNPRAYGFVEDVTKRVLAERALRESEFRFRAVAELTPGYIFEARRSEDGAVMMYASASFETVMGISRSEFDARGGWRWFCTPASLEAWWRAFDRLRAGMRAEVDLEGRNARGEDKWLRLKTAPVYDSLTGRRTGTMGAVNDITEAKRAELALLESQSVLQTIADGSAAQLALFSREGRCRFLNYSLLGRPHSEMLGSMIEDIVHPEHRVSARASFEHLIATGEPQDFESKVRWPNGIVHDLEIRMRAVRSAGRNVGVVTNITDVTQYRHQQESLRLQAHIIETMQEGVSMKDYHGVIQLTNPAFDGMFGYQRGELVGRSDEILSPLSSATYLRQREKLHSAVATSGPLTVELEGLRKDGSRFVASCTFALITVAGEQRIVTVLSDITERKRLEREILQIVNREQQRIGSDLHDGLGQELTGVALMLKSLAARLTRPADASVRADVEHITGLVNGAIDSTRGLARGLSPVSADRNGLVMGLESLVSQNNGRYGVHVSLHNDLPEWQEFDDSSANHLYRIAQEALANAVRHGKADRVSMALSADEGGQIELVIQDNGRGFNGSAAREAGMGLKIMRYRAQMLGGELSVESTPGSGTIIRCQCPDVEGRQPA